MGVFSVQIKNLFFDREGVRKAIGATRARALGHQALYLRKVARNSMRTVRDFRRASAPGTPPLAHAGQLKNLLPAFYDPAVGDAAVGPIPFRKGEAPWLNEFGGEIKRVYRRKPKKPGGPRRTVTQRAVYPVRAFMRPALARCAPKFPGMWEHALVSGKMSGWLGGYSQAAASEVAV